MQRIDDGFDSAYQPSGPNNKANAYYKKINNVKIARNIDTRAELLGDSRPVLSVSGSPTITEFSRSGTDYVQLLWRQGGGFSLSDDVAGTRYLAVGGGGSGGVSTRSPGGGGAGGAAPSSHATPKVLTQGDYTIFVGAGGPARISGGSGFAGSGTALVKDGLDFLVAGGGGFAGGSVNGGSGACGGGGGTNGTARTGGAGTEGGNGGNAITGGSPTTEGGGGGGGMAGAGTNGAALVGGNGGPGITVTWTETNLSVCGGGGARGGAGTAGSASHGGTSAGPPAGGPSLAASNGGGSGAGSNASGAGGDGLFVLVIPSANVRVEA